MIQEVDIQAGYQMQSNRRTKRETKIIQQLQPSWSKNRGKFGLPFSQGSGKTNKNRANPYGNKITEEHLQMMELLQVLMEI